MCLYPKLILNRKYLPSKKNEWQAPPLKDERVKYITARCGKCYECRKQISREWQIRMSEELKNNPNAIFVTLTISEEELRKLKKETTGDENDLATLATRRFLERVRKQEKKSIKHWFITELGHNGTNRIHLHGIIWDVKAEELVRTKWKYGHVFIGYANYKTITYIVKYMLKKDLDHRHFTGKVLCSAGIGKGYENSLNAKRNAFKEEETDETYICKNGAKINLPTYYRNKIYTEEEREKLFIHKIEKGEVWVMGEKCDFKNQAEYGGLLKYYREKTQRIHKDNIQDWEEEKYWKRVKRQAKYRGELAKRQVKDWLSWCRQPDYIDAGCCPF